MNNEKVNFEFEKSKSEAIGFLSTAFESSAPFIKMEMRVKGKEKTECWTFVFKGKLIKASLSSGNKGVIYSIPEKYFKTKKEFLKVLEKELLSH